MYIYYNPYQTFKEWNVNTLKSKTLTLFKYKAI